MIKDLAMTSVIQRGIASVRSMLLETVATIVKLDGSVSQLAKVHMIDKLTFSRFFNLRFFFRM